MIKERQTESERANAAEVARAAVEVQHAAEQQRTAQLTSQSQEAAVQSQVGITVISRYKDTRYKDILDVRTMHLGTKHCVLTAVVPLSKDNLL